MKMGLKVLFALAAWTSWGAICGEAAAGAAGRPTAPGPFQNTGIGGGGAMFAPSCSPHDPNLMFINCDMSALYKSKDGGKSWNMVDFRQTGSNTQCRVLYHPKDPNTLYFSGKVSRDQGVTWKPLSAKAPFNEVTEMGVEPDADTPILLVGPNDGAFLSRDGGTNWEKCAGISGKVARFYIDPGSPKEARRIFIATATGIWRSDDSGKTFQDKTAGLPWKEIRDINGGRAADGKKLALYCMIVSKPDGATSKGGVYRSDDNGDSWQPAMGAGINSKIAGGNAAQYYGLGVGEGKGDIVYTTSTGNEYAFPNHETVYRSDDGGKNWRAIFTRDTRMKECNVENGWIVNSICIGWGGFHTKEDGFYVNPKSPDVAMWTDLGESFVTTDGGKSWRAVYSALASGEPAPTKDKPGHWHSVGLEVTTCWDYKIDPHNHKRHYICYTDIFFAISEDSGSTWCNDSAVSGSKYGNTTYDLTFDPDVPNLVWAAQSDNHDILGGFPAKGPGGVQVSTDGGYHWSLSNQGLPNMPCRSICIDPKSPKDARVLFCTVYGSGVYKSVDGGKSWALKNNGMDLSQTQNVFMVKRHPDGTLFCTVSGCGKSWQDFNVCGSIYRSKDGGENWECITNSIKLHWTTDVNFDPRDSNVVYWGAISLPGKGEGGVYKTTDGGKSWARMIKDEDVAGHGGPPYLHVHFICLDPNHPDNVFAGTGTSGLWYSQDAGKTWKQLDGIPFQVINHVTFDPDDPDFVYVSSFGGGIWRGYLPWAKPANGGGGTSEAPKTGSGTPAPAPVVPAAIKPEMLAAWNQKLIDRAIAAAKEGAHPGIFLTLFGQREEQVKFASADAKSLSVEVDGNAMPVAWAKLSARDRFNLAKGLINEKSAEDHVLAAVMALAAGRAEIAEDLFAKARGADAKSGPTLVSQTREALGLK